MEVTEPEADLQYWTKLLRKIDVVMEFKRLVTTLRNDALLLLPPPPNVAQFLEHRSKCQLNTTNIERGKGGGRFSQHVMSRIVDLGRDVEVTEQRTEDRGQGDKT